MQANFKKGQVIEAQSTVNDRIARLSEVGTFSLIMSSVQKKIKAKNDFEMSGMFQLKDTSAYFCNISATKSRIDLNFFLKNAYEFFRLVST